MKSVVIEDLKEKKRLRKRIETSFSQLGSLFDLTKFLLRTIFGFASAIIRKILAYSRFIVMCHTQNIVQIKYKYRIGTFV